MSIYFDLLLHPKRTRNTMIEYIELLIKHHTLEGYKGTLNIRGGYLDSVSYQDTECWIILRQTKKIEENQATGKVLLEELTNRELIRLNKVLVKSIYF